MRAAQKAAREAADRVGTSLADNRTLALTIVGAVAGIGLAYVAYGAMARPKRRFAIAGAAAGLRHLGGELAEDMGDRASSARRAAMKAGKRARRGLSHAGDEVAETAEELAELMAEARERVAHAVEEEIDDLRTAIRRRRRKLGL